MESNKSGISTTQLADSIYLRKQIVTASWVELYTCSAHRLGSNKLNSSVNELYMSTKAYSGWICMQYTSGFVQFQLIKQNIQLFKLFWPSKGYGTRYYMSTDSFKGIYILCSCLYFHKSLASRWTWQNEWPSRQYFWGPISQIWSFGVSAKQLFNGSCLPELWKMQKGIDLDYNRYCHIS